MRPAFAASALCLGLLVLAARPAAAQTPAPSTPVPAAAAPAAAPAPASTANDAAARHLKRTACLKEARTKKLIGANKTAFLKNCIDAPARAISANRLGPDRP
ncbi:MAG TPA: hypothetical protein VHW71_19085 [Steroidobacteraceae bacterium]|jgi:hypothetical protein|nr:hypothetical protein [Steroidobacteraceae bacterium]